ncbi:MAG: hypothetical protein NTW87_18945 [Planctomycetota bacterium]|nr:hypothetical protein [Planctomycetota bacterium]
MKTKALEDENVARCLAARRKIERRYKTFDGLCAFLAKLEEQPFPPPEIARLARRGGPRPVQARAKPFDQGEVVERCRRAREELYKRFKTPEEMHAWLMSLEEQAGARRGLATAQGRAKGKAKPAVRTGKPVSR